MLKYKFDVKNQSPWIVDVYNQYLDYKNDGFVVEIGVGHTIEECRQFAIKDEQKDGIIRKIPKELLDRLNEETETTLRCGSNTAELIDLGWRGIYIEPVKEYCDEARIAHKNSLDRLTIVNTGASDVEETIPLHYSDTFLETGIHIKEYAFEERLISTQITNNILRDANCPEHFDILSIDVEGWEMKVLNGLDLNFYKPKIIIAEIAMFDVDLPNNYSLVKADKLNASWIRND
jgi:FkbM family methyltransferase